MYRCAPYAIFMFLCCALTVKAIYSVLSFLLVFSETAVIKSGHIFIPFLTICCKCVWPTTFAKSGPAILLEGGGGGGSVHDFKNFLSKARL